MAAAQPLQWRHRFPHRAVRRVGWLAAAGGAVAAACWLLFGAEPDRLASGETNPLSLVPPGVTGLVLLAALPLLLAVFRRPLVVADHYALQVRPGAWRKLLLPWAGIAEIAAARIRGEPLLLVRCDPTRAPLGDPPGWPDQAVLRAAGELATGFHLAVRLDEFAGAPPDLLASLAAWAPGQVRITDAL